MAHTLRLATFTNSPSALRLRTLPELLGLKAAQVVRYRNGMQERSLSPSTVNLRLAAVRGLFNRWLREGQVQGNPADPELVEGLPVSDESRTQGLTLDEVKRILESCDGTLKGLRDRALLMTLFYEGLRRSEESRLRYRDHDQARLGRGPQLEEQPLCDHPAPAASLPGDGT